MQERGKKKKEGEKKEKVKGIGRHKGRDTGERHRRRNIWEAKESDRKEQAEGKRKGGTDREEETERREWGEQRGESEGRDRGEETEVERHGRRDRGEEKEAEIKRGEI
jgi:hypothetical protein